MNGRPRKTKDWKIPHEVTICPGLFTALSFTAFAWQLYSLITRPTAQLYAERSLDSIRASIEVELLRTATPAAVTARLERALDQQPADWPVIDMIVSFAEEQQLEIPEALSAEMERRRLEELSLSTTAKECVQCMSDPRHCAFSAATLCDVAIEMSPLLGDLRSLKLAFDDMRSGQPVDQVDVGLAVVGLAATAATPFTAGSSYTLKTGTSLAKTARTSGRLSKPMIRFISRNSSGLVDFKRIPDSWYRQPGRLREAIDPVKLARLRDAAVDLGQLHSSLGIMETLRILKHIDTPDELRALRRSSEALDKRMPIAFEMLGKQHLIKNSRRWSDDAIRLASAGIGGLLGLIGLFWQLILSLLIMLKNLLIFAMRQRIRQRSIAERTHA